MASDNSIEEIVIKGARVNNLQNLSISIPRDRLVVITGVSGSGKSSLAFDTLFAEGQRRYVESLSAYARQFMGRIRKPDVDSITGIPPAIAIEQKVNTRNPRSTLGTTTEIYDYLRLLYARVGRTYSPISGEEVICNTQDDVLQYILDSGEGTYSLVLTHIGWDNADTRVETLLRLQQEGYSRFFDGKKPVRVDELLQNVKQYASSPVQLLIARAVSEDSPNNRAALLDTIQTAFEVGNGALEVQVYDAQRQPVKQRAFSTRFEKDGITFMEPNEYLFSFNNPLGACPVCGGYGMVTGIDPSLVVPNPELTVYEDAIACWRGEVMSRYKDDFVLKAVPLGFPIHIPYKQLTREQLHLLWEGTEQVTGIMPFFKMLEQAKYKIQNRVMISRYTGKTLCYECEGSRLRKEASYVRIRDRRIDQLLNMTVKDLNAFLTSIHWTPYEQQVVGRTLQEIHSRLQFLLNVGLGYLTLNRKSNTLSGGESQRVNLVTSLGSSLVGSMYILDEPSIGLHPRDTQRLLQTMKALRDLGNTVIVVEHDEEIMRAADQLIDIGPDAGSGGGRLVYQGPPPQKMGDDALAALHPLSRTIQFLTNPQVIPLPTNRRKFASFIELQGVTHNNLKNVTVRFPLQMLVAVTGVSGSGKSSLVRDVLYPALYKMLNEYGTEKPGNYKNLVGDVSRLGAVELVDQNPIGKSSRSNPVTYIKAYDDIRHLFSEQPYAKMNGYGHSHFSFNIDGGRCPECQGEGVVKVEMQFMADLTLTCEACGGKRFQSDVLEVRYKDKNIGDVLDMTVDQAIEFFGAQKKDPMAQKIAQRLIPLQQVGLSYVKLGQSSSSLSGGESQRVKLAYYLSKENESQPRLFIFDEPTTGLHAFDINRLLQSFRALLAQGHSVIVIEHNMDVVKCADWVIDMGPDAGDAGGEICFAGTPEELVLHPDLPTASALAQKLLFLDKKEDQ